MFSGVNLTVFVDGVPYAAVLMKDGFIVRSVAK